MKIDFQNIPIYSIFIILAFIINFIIIFIFGNYQKLSKNTIICFLTYELIGIITGAKILNMLQIKENTSFYNAGFSSYGGVIGGIVTLFVFSKLYKISKVKLLNLFIPTLPLLYSISKLGCFFAGCCYGILYDGFGYVLYNFATEAPLNTRLFPVQLIESITNLIIFLYILVIYKQNNSNLIIAERVFIFCGLSKFILEFFRYSWNGYISSTQILSLGFIIIGLILHFYNNKLNKIQS